MKPNVLKRKYVIQNFIWPKQLSEPIRRKSEFFYKFKLVRRVLPNILFIYGAWRLGTAWRDMHSRPSFLHPASFLSQSLKAGLTGRISAGDAFLINLSMPTWLGKIVLYLIMAVSVKLRGSVAHKNILLGNDDIMRDLCCHTSGIVSKSLSFTLVFDLYVHYFAYA